LAISSCGQSPVHLGWKQRKPLVGAGFTLAIDVERASYVNADGKYVPLLSRGSLMCEWVT